MRDDKKMNRTIDRLEDFYSCEVCWTCDFFNINYCECRYPMAESESYGDGGDYTYQRIRRPGWYRCALWYKRND